MRRILLIEIVSSITDNRQSLKREDELADERVGGGGGRGEGRGGGAKGRMKGLLAFV